MHHRNHIHGFKNTAVNYRCLAILTMDAHGGIPVLGIPRLAANRDQHFPRTTHGIFPQRLVATPS